MYALFDLDDTLHDKATSYGDCAKSIFTKYLVESGIDVKRFMECFVRENYLVQPKTTVFQKLAEKFSIDSETQKAMLVYFDGNFHSYAKRYDGVLEVMKRLKYRSVKMACVTNGRDFFQRNKG